MWIIRWFLTLLILVYAVLFATLNMSEDITLYLPWIPMFSLPVMKAYMVVLLSIVVGMLIWAIFALFASLELRGRIRTLERRNRDLKEELTRLRNLSLLDDHELEGSGGDPAMPGGGQETGLVAQDLDEVTAARNSGL